MKASYERRRKWIPTVTALWRDDQYSWFDWDWGHGFGKVFLGCRTLGAKTRKVSHLTRPQGTMGCLFIMGSLGLWASWRQGQGLIHACIPQCLPYRRCSLSSSWICCLLFNSIKAPRHWYFYVGMLPCFHGWEKDIVLVVLEREAASEYVGEQAVGWALRAFASLWTQNTEAANIAKKWIYSQHRKRANLNIPMHTIPIKGAGLQKLAILEVLCLIEGKSRYSLSLSFLQFYRESKMRIDRLYINNFMLMYICEQCHKRGTNTVLFQQMCKNWWLETVLFWVLILIPLFSGFVCFTLDKLHNLSKFWL